MTRLEDYASKYNNIRFERSDGILQMTLHTEDEPFVFSVEADDTLGAAFADVAADRANKVVILTGSGNRFCADFDYGSFAELINPDPVSAWLRIRANGVRMLTAFMSIEVPVISAINGPAVTHSELPLLADVVLAADSTVFQDATHFAAGGPPPGDGMHVVWTTLLGLNRGRYFLMTGQKIDAAEALRLGVVGEVLPLDELSNRAWELARTFAASSRANLVNTRSVLTMQWRRLLADQLHAGLTYEMAAALTGPPIVAPEPPVVDLLP
ncbi:MAG: enoyl-CoA hydratase/isomerase family protein [Hyphomicrobiales bacterium]|nr:MAG: enoyl-CoA hydratase/isomerase family protein [Hyphomicrobiales bacterium]